jgi:hypothetical protein
MIFEMRTFSTALFSILIFGVLLITEPAEAQLLKDLSREIEVDNIVTMNGTETHLYILSESEGLVVFRAYDDDTLQWLYSSSGMQERGHTLKSDIRFAYLFGDSRRLTVVEPTSVLGVYSSTILPAQPLNVARIGLQLFTALGQSGLGIVNLATPESVDTDITLVNDVQSAIDLASDNEQLLYILDSNNGVTVLNIDEDEILMQERISIDREISNLFLVENDLIGTDASGNIFYINSEGDTNQLVNVQAPVLSVLEWNDLYIVRTTDNHLWTGQPNGNFELWKPRSSAGNYSALTGSDLWVAEFNSVAPVILRDSLAEQSDSDSQSGGSLFSLKSIENVTIPYPRPLLLPIEFEGNVDPSTVTIAYEATFDNASIRGNSLYWQPRSSQTGRHNVTITATTTDGKSDSTSFVADVRKFNSPPRTGNMRPVTLPVGEEFELKLSAVDPDGPNPDLIRYIGVDMPDGATIDESTGVFTWAPSIRQVGNHTFRIIATDQFGAASSQNFELNVIEIDINEGLDEDLF